MNKKAFVFTGERPSNSGRDLREQIPARRLKNTSSVAGKVIINWGNSDTGMCGTQFNSAHLIWNQPLYVKMAANKLSSFEQLNAFGVPVVPFTTSKDAAKSWLSECDVVVRHKLRGHSGDGIEIIKAGANELPDAPLYTRYCPKKYEYRVHVMFGVVIDVTRKIRDPDREPISWQVRSHQNGFIFARANLKHREQIEPIAIEAIQVLCLDFGAVDIIIDETTHQPLVLEVNTAPGLEGQTLQSYVDGFRNKISVS